MEIFIFKQQVLIFHKEILIEYTTYNTVIPLYMNLDVSNFQRCKFVFACPTT